MFGFLRRKKPAETPAAPTDAAAVQFEPADAPEPGGTVDERALDAAALEAAALAAPPVDESVREAVADEAVADEAARAAEQAAGTEPAAKPGFWSRLIPGGRAPAPAPVAMPPAQAAEAAGPAAAEAPAPLPDRTPWLARLKQGLSRTSGNITTLFVGVKVDEALFEELETALLTSDTGVETTTFLLGALRERVKKERLTDPMQVKAALRALLLELLAPLEQPIDIDRAEPLVMMIAGVNGAGKTTSIGKLAKHLRREGKTVLLAAGDTFRAAAREQLAQWGSRNEVEVIAQQGGDPAAVAYDAVSAGIARRTGVVMVDTAGRLPTQTHLMDELRKVRRVIGKAMPDAPHEVLLVLDGNTGQNMLAQVKAFDDAVQLTGLVVTKLDGTAKGGALAALAYTRRAKPVPVYFIGVGEGIDDLQAFSADEFAAALLD
ncbi:MAG: signal recognition particle-docking protein FtsY [Burkholderiaceae bacterium]|jgi:fused signal recognition particle receptor|nr:signal recognition particle-docking protein FtsY [Burkholderiales bacterium]MCZ8107013.1 signal recognition particle-docking protein FtsY [Burkholderiales bacterium]MCZ8338385.1 signal recognition particle-docking protein FtsY [Burkholderiaceae bacterium]